MLLLHVSPPLPWFQAKNFGMSSDLSFLIPHTQTLGNPLSYILKINPPARHFLQPYYFPP